MTAEAKKFYSKVAALVLPIALQNLINVGISSIDVIMLGKVGEKVLSGASLGSQIQFVMSLFLFGVTSGASVLMAQYWGKRDLRAIETVFGIAVKWAVAVSICFTAAALIAPGLLMSLFTNDSEVLAQGMVYLRIVGVSYLFNALTMVYLNSMRNMERVLIASVVYLTSMCTNIVVNAILIFGIGPFPAMGIAGAAIGTVISRMVEFFIVIFYDRRINEVFHFHMEFLRRKDIGLNQDFRKMSLPVVANELMWGLGMSTMAAIMGHMGSAATAANSVAQVGRNLATVVAFGVASAASIMIGKSIGEGKKEQAKKNGRRFAVLSVIAGILGGLLILAVRPVVIDALELTDDARKILSVMLIIMSYYVVAQAYNTTLVVGIFRGGGDTRFGFYFDVIFMWGIAILGGAVAGFIMDASVFVVIFILLSDEVIKVPVATWRYCTYKWLNDVTR